MPYTTVTTGQVPTASFLNTNYRDQVISTVTSSTRPAGTEGQMIVETDTDLLQMYTGAAWREMGRYTSFGTWTPDYTYGGAARTPTSASGRYVRFGPFVYLMFVMTAQSTESGSAVQITNLPFTQSASTPVNALCGRGFFSTVAVNYAPVASATVIDAFTDTITQPGLTASTVMRGFAIIEV